MQERCGQDVFLNLLKKEVTKEEITKTIEILQSEGFIDEQRYANSFVRGKINIKKWGIAKIKAALYAKHIPESIITEALSEYLENDETTYQNNMHSVLQKKWESLRTESDEQKKKQKFIRFGLQKGYAYEDVKRVLKLVVSN